VSYSIEILRSAQKQLAKIEGKDRDRIIDAIRKLSSDPRPQGVTKLTGRPAWRIRVGNYRVIYEIDDNAVKILVVRIRHRRDVYR
jgi:mRNA interferase RelE/StbE